MLWVERDFAKVYDTLISRIIPRDLKAKPLKDVYFYFQVQTKFQLFKFLSLNFHSTTYTSSI